MGVSEWPPSVWRQQPGDGGTWVVWLTTVAVPGGGKTTGDLTQRGLCRAHHRALPPSEPLKLGLAGSSRVARQAWACCPDCLDWTPVCPDSSGGCIPAVLPTRAGLPPASAPAPPTRCYLGREDTDFPFTGSPSPPPALCRQRWLGGHFRTQT